MFPVNFGAGGHSKGWFLAQYVTYFLLYLRKTSIFAYKTLSIQKIGSTMSQNSPFKVVPCANTYRKHSNMSLEVIMGGYD